MIRWVLVIERIVIERMVGHPDTSRSSLNSGDVVLEKRRFEQLRLEFTEMPTSLAFRDYFWIAGHSG
jgi:hypothetical protein